MQQAATSIAGYVAIPRGNTFTVGDRITMGGARGGVMQLGFIQTTITEMGQPPSVQWDSPAMWMHPCLFTGRIIIVSNGKIFAEPGVQPYPGLPFIWEEMVIPITYTVDREGAEAIMHWNRRECRPARRKRVRHRNTRPGV